jgi:hypothetical protein
VRLYVNQLFYNEDDYELYYGKIEVFDGNVWHLVAHYQGNMMNDKFFWGLPYYEYDISHIADNNPNVKIRMEYNSNGDWDLEWQIDKVGLLAKVQQLNAAVLVSPANGALYQPVDVNLVWQKGSGPDPDGYKLYFGLDNPPQEMVYEGTNTQFSVADLQYQTTYYWKVIPFIGDEIPENIPVWSFTTTPEQASISQLPHMENFDYFPAPEMPFGWTSLVHSSSIFAEVKIVSPDTEIIGSIPFSAPNQVRFFNGSHIESTLMLYTPPVTVDMSNMRVRFYARTKATGHFNLPASNQIQVGVISDINNPNTFTPIGTVTLKLDYDQYMVSFQGYTGENNIIAFRAVMMDQSQLVYLDDVVFEEIPTDPIQVNIPSSIDFGNLEMNFDSASKTVSVRNWGGGVISFNPADIYLSGAGVDAFTLHNITSAVSLQAFECFEIALDFVPETSGNKDVILHLGQMQVPVSANSIDPDIVVFPYFENFDQVVTPALPLGWRKFVQSIDPEVDVVTRIHTGFVPSGPNVLRIGNREDADAQSYAITPLVIPGSGVQELWLRFYAYAAYRHDYMVVGVMSDREDISTFTEIEKIWMYAEGNFWEYAVRIPVTQEQFYIAFKPDFYRRQRFLFIDDVTIEPAPALYPVNLTVREASAEGTALQDVELKVLGHSPITTRQALSPADGQINMQLEAGTYTIFATLAGYQEREIVFEVTSQGATVIVDMTHLMYPPFNLTASTQPGEATLSWNDPGDVFEFRYDSGLQESSLGFGGDWQQELRALGSAYHYFAELHEISWYITEQGGPHETILLWVTGLDQYGYPDVNNILYWDREVANIDNQWNVYQLPEPILTPNGFFIGLAYEGFLSLGTDDGITHPYQFIPERHFALGNMHSPYEMAYPIEMWGFQVNLMLRGHGYKIAALEFEETPWPFKANTEELPELLLKRTASKDAGEPLVNVKSPVLSPWASSNVYLNDMDQPFESWVNESVFTFSQLAGGTYTAGVSTAFSTIESEILDITFTVEQSTNVETPIMSGMKVFPNPANNVVNIVSGEIIEQVKIFDMLGRVVYYSQVNSDNIIINTSQLKEGMYLMKIITADDITSKKVKIVR